jgi:hypothetical protein
MKDNKGNKKNVQKSEGQKRIDKEKRDLEIREILHEANRKTTEQLIIDEIGEIKSQNELKDFALGHIPDDPEEKYKIYYKGIEKLLKKFLPDGEKYKETRELIREEKSIFLTRGKKLDKDGIRGADSRMGYIQDMEEIMNVITKWAFESRNYFELYSILKDKNTELGYHSE